MASPRNKLEGEWLDAALHLLDRQVVDVDGLLVCNVDDLEVTEGTDGTLAVTGLLVGPAALWPRMSGPLSGWLRESWRRLGVGYADHDVPYYLDLDIVERIGSAVELSEPRDGLLRTQPESGRGRQLRRIGDLLGMRVRDEDGESLGKVLDVRLVPRAWKSDPRFEVTELIVGRGGPGSLLGYDRGDFNGPWIVDKAVMWRHRHTGRLPLDQAGPIDWEDHHLTATMELQPLRV